MCYVIDILVDSMHTITELVYSDPIHKNVELELENSMPLITELVYPDPIHKNVNLELELWQV